jgi:hypothetical protein
MIPGKLNLAIYRGDTYRWRFTLWEDPERTRPVFLTDATVKSEIRDKPAGNVLAVIACTIQQPNFIDAVLDADASSGLPPKGVWDLELTFAAVGDVRTVLAGAVAVTPDVTNSGTPAP